MASNLPPPPAVMRSNGASQRRMDVGNNNDAFDNGGDDWQPIDYWYNRVLSKSSPAANTANPSALGLIAFGYTTALLQVSGTLVCSIGLMFIEQRASLPVSDRTSPPLGAGWFRGAACFMFVCVCSQSLVLASRAGRSHQVDRGYHYLHHYCLCSVLRRPCTAASRHVGVPEKQHVRSYSLLVLRWLLACLWYLCCPSLWWRDPRERGAWASNDAFSLGHLDLLLFLVSLMHQQSDWLLYISPNWLCVTCSWRRCQVFMFLQVHSWA